MGASARCSFSSFVSAPTSSSSSSSSVSASSLRFVCAPPSTVSLRCRPVSLRCRPVSLRRRPVSLPRRPVSAVPLRFDSVPRRFPPFPPVPRVFSSYAPSFPSHLRSASSIRATPPFPVPFPNPSSSSAFSISIPNPSSFSAFSISTPRLPSLRGAAFNKLNGRSFIFGPHNFSSFAASSTAIAMHEAKSNDAVSLSSIQHSEVEEKIFTTLKDVLNKYDLDTQLRVAGGWVRDKLLGKESYDIDIAIDNMLGEEFCNKVNDYLKNINAEVCGVGVILSNPDQSKHLETARMRMFGVWIDFVNLRSETYADHSRIPEAKFGSPEEDAYRRDLTINSLFYNINTFMVEDFTGRGLTDLRAGIIATPLPAKTTFLDDPLRVLRAIRFAARLNYKFEEDLKQAAADEEVKVALANKVSLERIGVEVDLMIMCAHPVRAIEELVKFNVFWTVFRLPLDLKPHISEETQRLCLITLKEVSEVLKIFGFSKLTAEQRRICYFSAILLPFREIMYQDRRKKQIPLSSVIMKESLKLKTKDAEQVASLHKGAETFQEVIDILLKKKHEPCDDEEKREHSTHSEQVLSAGMILWGIKDLWRVALLLSSVLKLPLSINNDDKKTGKRADLCIAAEEVIVNLGLENVWDQKPLLDGKVIMAELGLKQGGPKVKEWQDRLRKWQLCHLEATVDECLKWFREEKCKENVESK